MSTATETSAATNCTRLGLKADLAPVAIANTAADRADPAAKTLASVAAQADPAVRTAALKAMDVDLARKPTQPSNPPPQTRRGQDPHQHANSNRNERGHQNRAATLLF